MTLFEMPSEKKRKTPRVPTAGDIAANKAPLYEVRVGTTSYYLRAYNEENARAVWRFRYGGNKMTYAEDELRTRRLLHADIVELVRLDPKLARRLSRL